MTLGAAGPGERRPRDVASAVLAGQRRLALSGRLIVVGGGKGGTGKSVITANLGVLRSLTGRQVVLVDADLGLANLHLLLGVEPDGNLVHLLERGGASQSLLRQGPGGVRLLPGASGVGRLAGLNRGELRRLIERLEPHLHDSDLVLVDLSSGISPSTRLFLSAAQEVVLVTNPEPSAMLDAYGVIKLLAESDRTGAIHLVVNRARNLDDGRECGQRILETARRFLRTEVNLLGCIPEDDAVLVSSELGRPVVLDRPQSPAAIGMHRVADRLFDGTFADGSTASTFFAVAKRLLAPRRRSARTSCV